MRQRHQIRHVREELTPFAADKNDPEEPYIINVGYSDSWARLPAEDLDLFVNIYLFYYISYKYQLAFHFRTQY